MSDLPIDLYLIGRAETMLDELDRHYAITKDRLQAECDRMNRGVSVDPLTPEHMTDMSGRFILLDAASARATLAAALLTYRGALQSLGETDKA